MNINNAIQMLASQNCYGEYWPVNDIPPEQKKSVLQKTKGKYCKGFIAPVGWRWTAVKFDRWEWVLQSEERRKLYIRKCDVPAPRIWEGNSEPAGHGNDDNGLNPITSK